MECGSPAPRICINDIANPNQRRKTMKTIILTSLLGAVLATTAHAGSDIRELARTGSTITVHGFVDGR
jgi:hypothetical protein